MKTTKKKRGLYGDKNLFMLIGLFISLGLVFSAFQINTHSPEHSTERVELTTYADPIMPITQHLKEQRIEDISTDRRSIDFTKATVTPRKVSDIKQIDPIKNPFNGKALPDDKLGDPPVGIPLRSRSAIFPGGVRGFADFMQKNIEYPDIAKILGLDAKLGDRCNH